MVSSNDFPDPHASHDASWPTRLESFRPYLLGVASRRIRSPWRGKLAASDLVQQTLVEAVAACPTNQLNESELQRWLRRILANNLHDGRRKLLAAKRAIGREAVLDKSRLLRGAASAASEEPVAVAMRNEQDQRLDRAIAQLSPAHRRVIELRHAEDRRFSEIAETLGLSENAAQKLWMRATEELRRLMKELA